MDEGPYCVLAKLEGSFVGVQPGALVWGLAGPKSCCRVAPRATGPDEDSPPPEKTHNCQ